MDDSDPVAFIPWHGVHTPPEETMVAGLPVYTNASHKFTVGPQVLGSGTFSHVFQASNGSVKYAAKQFKVLGGGGGFLSAIHEALITMYLTTRYGYGVRAMENPAVRLVGVMTHDTTLVFVLEAGETSINKYVRSKFQTLIDATRPLDVWAVTLPLQHQVLDTVGKLRQCRVVHRDIKEGNMLVVMRNGFPCVCLCDFGTAHFMHSKMIHMQYYRVTTFDTRAPEATFAHLLRRVTLRYSVDDWAAGVICINMILKRPLVCAQLHSKGSKARLAHIEQHGEPATDIRGMFPWAPVVDAIHPKEKVVIDKVVAIDPPADTPQERSLQKTRESVMNVVEPHFLQTKFTNKPFVKLVQDLCPLLVPFPVHRATATRVANTVWKEYNMDNLESPLKRCRTPRPSPLRMSLTTPRSRHAEKRRRTTTESHTGSFFSFTSPKKGGPASIAKRRRKTHAQPATNTIPTRRTRTASLLRGRRASSSTFSSGDVLGDMLRGGSNVL